MTEKCTRRGTPTHRRRGQHDSFRLSPNVEKMIRSDLSSLLVELRDTPMSVEDRFKFSYLENEIFSKFLDPRYSKGERERETAAIAKWHAAELQNAKTNVRLYFDEAHFSIRGELVSSEKIIERARDTIAKVLGDKPDLEVLYGTFTSGASTKFPRGVGVIAKKFMDEAHVTETCYPWFTKIRELCSGWDQISNDVRGEPLKVEVVRGSVMFTVPKTSEIDRCAAKEPGLNMFCQKGIGDFIRRRLKSILRQDLNDQSINQLLAWEGSRTGRLATIDLSSASDTISEQLVYRLLPFDWFHLLNDVRSRQCRVKGEWVELNMFSSMGNAFTFELETLIFWSLVNAVCYFAGAKGTISVYGDDIICPSSAAGLVARVFSFFGFKVNTKKSKWRGWFRESCGKHWYKGVDVTPFYIREPIASVPRLIHFLNRLRCWAGQGGRIDERVYPLWAKYALKIPRYLRGGRDLESILVLVTDESPRKRLLPKTCMVEGEMMAGSYLHWLRVAEARTGPIGPDWPEDYPELVEVFEPLVTSDIRKVLPYYRVVPSVAESTGMEPALLFAAEWSGCFPETMTPVR